MKLSKPQIKLHKECEALLKKDVLTYDEKCFVLENWFPAYSNQIGEISSFFTPFDMANTFKLHITGRRIIDLCAGIGMLTFSYYHNMRDWDKIECDIVCIERNPQFVEVGKKILPEATWICADVLDESIYKDLGRFDTVVSNPPFGKVKSENANWLNYKGAEFEYKIIEIASKLSNYGAFIIGAMSAPFEYSGNNGYKVRLTDKYIKFANETGLSLKMNIGVDCDYWIDEWKGTAPKVEIVIMDIDEPEDYSRYIDKVINEVAPTPMPELQTKQDEIRHKSWVELFGYKAEDIPAEQRFKNWLEWKEACNNNDDDDGAIMVEYWNNCEGCFNGDIPCKHLDKANYWCKLQGLPTSVNPVLTISGGMIGMACMGTGYETPDLIQPTLF